MTPSDGPPARNTQAAACNVHHNQAPKGTTPCEEPLAPEQSDMPACPESTVHHKESILMSITTLLSGEQTKGNDSPEDSATSKHGTIHEEIYEQEQSFTTTPGSLGPSANPARFRMLSPKISRDAEQAQSTPLPQ